MSKNRIVWILAMFLALLPAANAQVLGMSGANWYYFLINALVIGFAIFLVQAVLVPNKDAKEKTSIWLIVVGVALLISWFNGRGGLIWKTGSIGAFFATYKLYFVLVNAAVIGLFLYFLLQVFVNEKLPKSPEGQIGFVLLVAVVAVLAAVKVGNQWIWATSNIMVLRNFLFGPEGILTLKDNRLWAFVTSWALLVFFFNGFLMKDGGKINMFLALLFAANMASAGISLEWVLRIGEIIFVLILQRSLSESIKPDWLRWLVAILIVGWASYAVSSGTEYKGLIGFGVGKVIPATLWTLSGILFVGLAILLSFGVYKALSALFGEGSGAAPVTTTDTATESATSVEPEEPAENDDHEEDPNGGGR
jgi:hypothetical protein